MSSLALPERLRSAGANTALNRRRLLFGLLVGATMAGLVAAMVATLSAGGFTLLDALIVFCFALTTPWTVIGFWNAVIGFSILYFARDSAALVTPLARSIRGDEPIDSRTAVLLCIRNEEVGTVSRNLNAMLDDLAATGALGALGVFILSDTDRPEIAAAEEALAADVQARWRGRIEITYRRRPVNRGYKAGNIRDFCERWGGSFDFALVLDADSFMSARKILRMIRLMQANPTLGILQSLTVGMPSDSPFARTFQFGMRLGMRSYTVGSAWWQGDCGPFWGHNGLLRLAPFIAHCDLPDLPGGPPLGGPVLSHDQLEAALMRRAGYEVRVLAEEEGSWEVNPPTLLEYIRRDLRWCQGNMQYFRFLFLPGLRPVSRMQLLLAILMYVGSPCWMAFVAITLGAGALAPGAIGFAPEVGVPLFFIVLAMVFAPKFATVAHVLAVGRERRSFGGGLRIVAGVLIEIVFATLLAPTAALAHSLLIGRLLLGRSVGWLSQQRHGHSLRFGEAFVRLRPQTAAGMLALLATASLPWTVVPYVAPLLAGFLLAVPFAVYSSRPALGGAMRRAGLAAIPEESAPPAELSALDGPRAIPALPVAA